MKSIKKVISVVLCTVMMFSVFVVTPVNEVKAVSPYIPLWEHMPDGEPRIFQDPDDPTGTIKRLYVFGSHDMKMDAYCGPDISCWSAPLNDLNNWRKDGPVFISYNESTGTWDRLFAPDIVEVRTKDPTNPKAKQDGIVYTYYLYPHNISDDVLSFNGFRMNMVAKADRPDGPFEVINWVDPSDRTLDTLGPIGFDPGAFIDYDEDDNIKGVYVFWGYQTATAGEMDPETMYTLKSHTESQYNSKMYSYESFGALTAAISSAQAVYDNADATQAQVDAVIYGVLAALPNLVRLYTPKPSPDALKASIAIGKALISKYPGRYTTASTATLATRISEGETRINFNNRNSTQAQIETAMNNILTAINGLVQAADYAEPVKKEALYVVIKRALSVSNDRPIDYVIPSSASTDNDTSYPYVHQRAKDGRTTAQVRSAFSFFEASSIRKIGNKYVMIFSGQSGSEYGMSGSSTTLRYAYGDSPMGPWVDGGVLVDSRGPEVNQAGSAIAATNYSNNTHGSIIEIPSTNPDGSVNPDGESQWYVFFHRPPRGNGNARQSMVSPIKVEWSETSTDDGGYVRIRGFDPYADDQIWTAKDSQNREYTGAEVTSEGFNPFGLNPYQYYSAGIACYFVNNNPGSVINVLQDSYDVWSDHMPVTGMQNNYTIGYKYFDFENYTKPGNNTHLDLYLTPRTAAAFTVDIMMDAPWENIRGGVKIGEISVPANSRQIKTRFSAPVPTVDEIGQKHAIYLKLRGGAGNLCDIDGISFSKQETMFADDFSNALSSENWTLAGTAGISGNLLRLPAEDASAITELGLDWRNYEVESDIRLQSGNLSLTFMRTGDSYYELLMKADGSLELSSIVNGGVPRILGGAAETFAPGTAARVGVNTDSGVISIRVNGILALQVKNRDHDDGGVGFAARGNGAAAEIDNVLVRSATEKDVAALPVVSIEVDGNPIDVSDLSPTNYTVFNGIYDCEVYETYYPVPLTRESAPVVTASCDSKDVKISVSQPEGPQGVAMARFNKDGAFKTYIITFGPGAVITPEKNGLAYGNAGKAAGDMVDLGGLKDLVSADKWGGDWDIWVNVASNPSLNAANFGANTQAGLVIFDGTDPARNYLRINTRYNTATQVGAGAGWVVNDGTPSSATSTFLATHKRFYLRIVKRGNTLQAFGFTSASVSTNFANIGAAQTFTPEFFENARIQAYATNASASDLTAVVTVMPDIMGVHSSVYNTYELLGGNQIAVDAAGKAVGDGIGYTDSVTGANAAEKATNAISAQFAAKGVVTVKKTTDSQVKRMNYDTDLSSYVFDTCAVTAAPGSEDTGPYTLTLKSGRASMVISPYNVVNVTGKNFEELTALINKARETPVFACMPSSRSRLQEALAHAVKIKANDDAIVIADAYDMMQTALNNLRFIDEIMVNPSHESLAAAAGQELVTGVFVPAPVPGGAQYKAVYGIGALYSADGRLISLAYDTASLDTQEAFAYFSAALPIPEKTTGLLYKFFLWNAETMAPLIAVTSLE